MNHGTRRYPRTLNEAFGPYAELHVEPPRRPFIVRHAASLFVAGFVLAILLSLFFQGHQ